MAWLDIATQMLLVVFYSLKVALLVTADVLLWIAHVAMYTAHLATYPICALWRALLIILAPIIYPIRFILSPFISTLNNLPRLEPLYIYFGTAAFVGIGCGIIFSLTNSGMVAILGLHDAPHHQKARPYTSRRASSPSSLTYEEDRQQLRRQYTPPKLTEVSEQERLDALLSSVSSPDSDIGNLSALQGGSGGWWGSPNTKRKRRSAAASRFSTILEEDDDSI